MKMTKDNFTKFKLNILAKSSLLAALVVLTGFILRQKPFSIGYLAGFLTSVAYFSNAYSSIKVLSGKKIKKIKLYLAARYILFYVILALVLITSYNKSVIMCAGVVIGFLSIRLVIYIDAFILNRLKIENKDSN